jgi:hypothetical protein
VLLSDSGAMFSSSSGAIDLTRAGATAPLDLDNSGASLQQLPIGDIDTLAQLIGHATHRSRTDTSHSGKKQRIARQLSAGGSSTERLSARASSLLPQFTKGFSLYMKRWNASYYFGHRAASPPTASAAQLPASPKLKPLIATVAHQSLWSAAAGAAKQKIAQIEAEHAKRRSAMEPKLIQVCCCCCCCSCCCRRRCCSSCCYGVRALLFQLGGS